MFRSDIGIFRGARIEPVTSADRVGVLHVFSGSFNPLHDGHRWMYDSIDGNDVGVIGRIHSRNEYAVAATTFAKYFEISTKRVGKEDLSEDELRNRLRQFTDYAPVLVTQAPLFEDKLSCLRDVAEHIIFHIGYDTYERLLAMHGATTVAAYRCSFCVWPRGDKELQAGCPRNCYASNLSPPSHLVGLSSTKVREGVRSVSGETLRARR